MNEERRTAGQPAKRVDGVAKVTGSARYSIDLTAPGMAHAIVVRSTRAHARIARIDRTAAERAPGVLKVITGDDLVKAGLTPKQVLQSATRDAARCWKVDQDLGTVEAGRWADFVVLDADPLANISNTQKISAVYIAGNNVPR